MIKRIITLLLITALLPISAMAAAPFDVEESNQNYEEILILTSLGIMDMNESGEFCSDQFITRAETAKIAAVVHNIDVEAYTYENPYTDVETDSEYAPYIAFCKENDLMIGIEDGIFAPDEYMTAEQFNVIIIRLLGYEKLANVLGAYPKGYRQVAEHIDLSKYLKQSGDYLQRGEAAYYLYKALDTHVSGITGTDKGNLKYDESDETLSERYMRLRRIEGTVTANEYSNMPAYEGVNTGMVRIDGVAMRTGMTDIKYEIGKYVVVYAELDADDEPIEVKAYVKSSRYNKEIEFRTKDIVPQQTSNERITVNNQGKTKTYKLSNDCIVIRNGEVLTSYSHSVFNVAIGKISIVDTNDNGSYNLVIIEDAESYIFKQYNENTKSLNFYYGKAPLTIADDTPVEVYVDNERASLSDLTAWMSVFIYKTTDNKVHRIDGSTKMVKGTYTSKSTDTVGIDNVSYDSSADFETYALEYKPISFGMTYTFIVNPYDEIVAVIEMDEKRDKYGFVLSTWIDESDTDAYIKLYNEDDEKKSYKLKENIVIEEGPQVNRVPAKTAVSNSEHGLVDGRGNAINQLVKFRVDDEGELERIFIAVDNTGGIYEKGEHFTLDFQRLGTGTIFYNSGNINGIYWGDTQNMKVFVIPATVDEHGVVTLDNLDDISIETGKTYNSTNQSNFELYDVDEYYNVGVMLKYAKDERVTSDAVAGWNVSVINRVYESVISNDEIGYIIEYYENGTLNTVEAEADCNTKACSPTQWDEFAGIPVGQLRCGDIIQIKVDKNKIKYIHMLGRGDNIEDDRERVCVGSTSTASSVPSVKLQTIPGKVVDTNDGFILVSTVAGNGDSCQRSIKKTTSIKYYLYDTNSLNDAIKVVDATEITQGDKIFVRLNAWASSFILIVR